MSYFFFFPGYQTKCVIELLFRQLMTSWTLRLILDHPPKQWPTGRKREKDRNTKIEFLENEKSSLDEIKSTFHSFWRAIIWWKNKNLMKIVDTSFKLYLDKWKELTSDMEVISTISGMPINIASNAIH